jgi:hypothetical protein
MKTPSFYNTRTLWICSIAALLAIGALPSALRAQSQDNTASSVAEAARRAKEQKKNSAKDTHVITNDTISLRPASADTGAAPPAGTVITSAPARSTEAAAALPAAPAKAADSAASTSAPAQPALSAGEKKEQSAEATKAKEMLAQLQTELDVLKRELALDSDSYYSNPDYARDADGKAKLDELQKMIGDKQVSLEDLKKQVAELLLKAGISPDTSKPIEPPKN